MYCRHVAEEEARRFKKPEKVREVLCRGTNTSCHAYCTHPDCLEVQGDTYGFHVDSKECFRLYHETVLCKKK